jgi:hypothetical protein
MRVRGLRTELFGVDTLESESPPLLHRNGDMLRNRRGVLLEGRLLPRGEADWHADPSRGVYSSRERQQNMVAVVHSIPARLRRGHVSRPSEPRKNSRPRAQQRSGQFKPAFYILFFPILDNKLFALKRDIELLTLPPS